MNMFNKFIGGQKKEEKKQQEKDEITSNIFINRYEELCQEFNRQIVPIANYTQDGIKLTLSTKKVEEDIKPVLRKV